MPTVNARISWLLAAMLGAAALVVLPAGASYGCVPGVSTSPDGTVHEGGSCPTPGGGGGGTGDDGGSGVPVPEWPKTFTTPSCSGGGVAGRGAARDDVLLPAAAVPRRRRSSGSRAGCSRLPVPWPRSPGTFCADPDEEQVPVITPEMVTDAAEQVAPKPVAQVQPGVRSYVNIPNNYFTENDETTIPVTVLGQQIQVTFVPTEDTWDFGDGVTATGSGVEDAEVGAAGAVEHAYARSGSYAIHVSRTYTVRFTLPGGVTTVANAFTIPGPDTVLPVGEIQTRVDATG